MHHFSPRALAKRPTSLRWAHRLTWLLLWLMLLTYIIGASWDAVWHRTRVFDTFYSPPHLFIYIMVALITLFVIALTFTPALRVWFGSSFPVLPLPFPVPGTLVLTGGGFFLLGLAGILDDIWHSTFGLDETFWSTPHALLGWGLCVVTLGFVSCLLTFRHFYPLRWYSRLLLGWLLAVCTIGPFLNPFANNRTPEVVWATAHIPILAVQAQAQHTFRIYLAWNLTLTNPLFLPLVIFWVGLALSLARYMGQRAWIVLVIAWLCAPSADVHSLVTIAPTIEQHVKNWLPLPVLPTAIILLLLLKFRVAERWAWIIAGAIFALLFCAVWQPDGFSLLLALVCTPFILLGAHVGQKVYTVLEQPTALKVWSLLFIVTSACFFVGSIDLYLRNSTP